MLDREVPAFSIGRRDVLMCFMLAAMVAAVYWPIRGFEFVRFDDPLFLSDNPNAVHGLTKASAKWAVTSLVMSNYMPVTVLSALTDISLWGLRPGPLHVMSATLQAVSTIEWYLLWLVLTGRRAPSFFVAGLFALHPMHVEPVAWISCRGDMLCMAFSVATLLTYVRWVRSRRKYIYVAAIVLFGLAILSKTIAMVLPGVMLLLNVWPLGRFDRRQTLLELTPFFALAVVAACLGLWARYMTRAVSISQRWTVADRLFNGMLAYGSYLIKAFWPEPMRAIYPLRVDYSVASAIAAMLLLTLITYLVLRSRKRRPYLFIGWLWFVGALLPTIGIVQTGPQSMADRYTYLPYVGLSVALVWGCSEMLQAMIGNSRAATTILLGVGIAILIACGVDSRRQLQYWRNSMSLFAHASEYAPDDPILNAAMGTEYRLAGRPDLALDYYSRSVAVLPNNADIQNNLGWVLVGIDAKQAIPHFVIAATVQPNAQRWWSLGYAQQRTDQVAAAVVSYRRALQLDPDYAPAKTALRSLPIDQ